MRFRADGEIYFSNNSGSSPSISALSTGAGDGIYPSADAGDGVMAVSNTGKAVHAIAAGNEPAVHANGQGTAPALEVEQNGAGGTDIATFHDGTGDGLVVQTDGGLAWNSATGSRTTTDALQLFDDTEKGVVLHRAAERPTSCARMEHGRLPVAEAAGSATAMSCQPDSHSRPTG